MTMLSESDMEGNAKVFGDTGGTSPVGIAVVVDTSRARALLWRIHSILAKGKELSLPEGYLKEQALLFEEIVHLLPDTIQVFTHPGDAISNKSDRLSA